MIKSKKGIVTHPVTLFVVAVIIGLVLAYVWVKYVNIWNPYC